MVGYVHSFIYIFSHSFISGFAIIGNLLTGAVLEEFRTVHICDFLLNARVSLFIWPTIHAVTHFVVFRTCCFLRTVPFVVDIVVGLVALLFENIEQQKHKISPLWYAFRRNKTISCH